MYIPFNVLMATFIRVFSFVCQALYTTPKFPVIKKLCTTIKTHGSESWGQEEAGLRDEPVSYLQVASL